MAEARLASDKKKARRRGVDIVFFDEFGSTFLDRLWRTWAPRGQREFPILLGFNEVQLKSGANVELLARVPDEFWGHPLLVVGQYGQGRTLAWTSDIGPHWLPETFATWDGYARLWRQALTWLIGEQ